MCQSLTKKTNPDNTVEEHFHEQTCSKKTCKLGSFFRTVYIDEINNAVTNDKNIDEASKKQMKDYQHY